MASDDFDCPMHLDPLGVAAFNAIRWFISDRDLNAGGCKTFYSPDEWKTRGEKYGLESVLIVCHDGGDVAPYFNYDYEQYDLIEKMSEHLKPFGFYAEQCTGWYSAIYPI